MGVQGVTALPYEILEALLTKCVCIFYVSVPTSISIMSLSALDSSRVGEVRDTFTVPPQKNTALHSAGRMKDSSVTE